MTGPTETGTGVAQTGRPAGETAGSGVAGALPDGAPTALPTGAPEEHGLPAAALLTLLDTLDEAGLDPHALVVARHGTVLLRAAWAPYRTDRPALVYSASKTVTALAVALLTAEGRLAPDDPVDRHLDLPNPHGITVHHLLTMTTGHTPEQLLAAGFDPRALLGTPPEHPVGSRFAYSSPASALLARLVLAVSGQQPTAYLRPRLLDPLGIGPRWWRTLDGVEQGFSGLHLTVDDLARIGLLLADDGRSAGRQLVPAALVGTMTTPWAVTRSPDEDGTGTGGDWSLGYGYQVWRSRHGFRLDGAFGQFAVVDTDRDLVIAYQGATTDAQRTLDAFWALGDALHDQPLPDDPATTAALAARVRDLDTWGARGLLAPAVDPAPDPAGWALTDRDADGWWLDVPRVGGQPGGRVPVPVDRWQDAALTPTAAAHDDRSVPVATRGERLADGTVHAHLVTTTSPHRLLLARDPAGRLDLRWHTAPLWRPELATLLVPAVVADPDRSPPDDGGR